ncbi:hypothetical protein RF55_5462 [Lasius niger]|uniref:Nitrate reductase associated protein n=1 Tax=Lasius niger TaxID=67767 RepID=A0A0J7KVU9_LASNI|nr:hypothetical protein RF55_5462 [Lasius niger]
MTQNKPTPEIFEFEEDFAGSLRCITMSVRQKLDFAGTKLSLEQWEKLSDEQREAIFQAPCAEEGESRKAYEALVRKAVKDSSGEEVKTLADPALELWKNTDSIPDCVTALAKKMAGREITLAEWAGLAPLQRFALLKLSQSRHESEHLNFRPAMKEFGLLSK